jgi:hypothetical protein
MRISPNQVEAENGSTKGATRGCRSKDVQIFDAVRRAPPERHVTESLTCRTLRL